MKILAVNCGSSSLKFQMYEMPEENVLISGVFERIGIDNSFYTIKINGEKIKKDAILNNHEDAVRILVDELLERKIVDNLDEIKGIGHRVVQGADKFDKSVLVDDSVLKTIDELSSLAPLHNPAALIGINAFKEFVPNASHVVVFDTAFHQTMAKETYLYALPYELYEKYGIRKYGAHGTSHKYVTEFMQDYYKENKKLIVCHIGSGASITAVKDGKVVDTSMGFTPNAGVIMGTRTGDIDASIIPYLIKNLDYTADDIDKLINKESGFKGITGGISDSRDIEDGIKAGNEKCEIAQKMFVRSIVNYIAKYYVLLNGVDAICFTAGIGENSILTRQNIMDSLSCLGVTINTDANSNRGKFIKISADDSKIECFVVPTDEEVMIARDTFEIVK